MEILHPAGRRQMTIAWILFFLFFINGFLAKWDWLSLVLCLSVTLWLIFTLQFFRYPKRQSDSHTDGQLISPADGKVVVIEEVLETKYFNEKRLQVSIFMSPVNVHINYTPCSGTVTEANYMPGKYLFAAHPKSSELNERSEIIINHQGTTVYMKQIAGIMARRILYNVKKGDQLKYNDEVGFIRFGSRVDLLLPLDTEIEVKIGDKVKGNKTLIGHLPRTQSHTTE